MSLLKVLLFFLVSQTSMAYIPSLDALLRNGSNPEVGRNTIAANFVITEIDAVTNRPQVDETGLMNKYAVKYVIFNDKEKYPRITQVNYKGGIAAKENLVNFFEKYFYSLKKLFSHDENKDAEFFYATLAMLLNNKSNLLLESIDKLGEEVQRNRDLVNKDKLTLLRNYKFYLDKLKEGTNESLENPLRPKNEEERMKVQKLSKQGFLNRDERVKRVKLGEQFYWIVETEKYYLRFDYNHRIREMRVNYGASKLEFVFGKFVSFRSNLEFPEFIWLTDSQNKKYEIRATSLKMFPDNRDQHRKRHKMYRESAQKNQIVDDQIRPGFLL